MLARNHFQGASIHGGMNTLEIDPATESDTGLVLALQRGDDEAFEILVRQHSARLLIVIRRILQNDSDAQDALQDTFLNIYKSIHRFTPGARLSSWLYGIAVHCAQMKARTRSRQRERAIEDLLPNFTKDGAHADALAGWNEPAGESLDRADLRTRVRQRIAELPESYKTVLLLRDIEQFDTEETAAILKISTGAVKVRLHRARQALRTLLESDLYLSNAAHN